MIREISMVEAVKYLEAINHYAYRKLIKRLQSRRQVMLLSEEPLSMAICRDNDVGKEVYLVGEDPERLVQFVNDVYDSTISLFIGPREMLVLPMLRQYGTLNMVSATLDFHCSSESLRNPVVAEPCEVLRFEEFHREALREQDINEEMRDWLMHQWTSYFKSGRVIFGVLDGDRVVSFCAISPDGEIAMIYTIDSYRGNGFAKQSLYEATRSTTRVGGTAYYNVDVRNGASIATATGVGYICHAHMLEFKFDKLV